MIRDHINKIQQSVEKEKEMNEDLNVTLTLTLKIVNATLTCWIKTLIGTGGTATSNVIAATR